MPRQYYHFLSAYIRQFTSKIAFQRCTITYPLFAFPLQKPFCVTFVITSISFTPLLPKKSELKRQYQNLVSSHFNPTFLFFFHSLASFRFCRENEIIKTKCPLHTAVERAKEITRKIRWKSENSTISQVIYQQNGAYSANLIEMIFNLELYGRTISRCIAYNNSNVYFIFPF